MTHRMCLVTGLVVLVANADAFGADKKVQLTDLPVVVRKAVQDHTKGATLVGLAEEREAGKVFYEAETRVKGHTRDLLFDSAGTLVEVEEEAVLEALPSAVQSALRARGNVLKVESVTKGEIVIYEAQVTRNGKATEVIVDTDGKVVHRR